MNNTTNIQKSSMTNQSNGLTKIDFQHVEIKDIAVYCMVSTSTVRRWLENGKIKAIRLPSNQYRVSKSAFREFLERYNIPIRADFFHQTN
jgi:excisionase family DNA binding protein